MAFGIGSMRQRQQGGSDARAAARSVALPLADPFDLHVPCSGRESHTARQLGTALFWAAVVALIGARVALFDPAAMRPVGGFPAPLASTQTATTVR